MKDFIIKIKINDGNEVSVASYSGFTWEESLREEENDRKTLTFNVLSDETNLLKYMRVGRRLTLEYNDRKNKKTDFIITQIVPVEKEEGGKDYFEIAAEDYANFVFSRNNVGLNLNTMEDEDYFNWLDENELEGETQDLLKYILIKGRLFNEDKQQGWRIVGDDVLETPFNYRIENGQWLFSLDATNKIVADAIAKNKRIEVQALVYKKRGHSKGNKRKGLGKKIFAPYRLGKLGTEKPRLAFGRALITNEKKRDFTEIDLSDFGHNFISDLNSETSTNYKHRAQSKDWDRTYYSKAFTKHSSFFQEVAFTIIIDSKLIPELTTKWTKFRYPGYDHTKIKRNYSKSTRKNVVKLEFDN